MTFKQIGTMISELATALKCDYAYSAFKDGKARNRFLVFYYSGSDDLYADGLNYQNIEGLTIEFYSPTKDINAEKTIKETLNSHGLTFDKSSVWVNDEKVILTSYTMEVLING